MLPPRFFAPKVSFLLAAMICLTGAIQAETIHVFLIGGQSNADGRANISGSSQNLTPVLANPQTDVPIYYGLSASGPSGSYPFLNSGTLTDLKPGISAVSGKFGPELSFGRSMADYYASTTGESIALIKYAVGGTDLAVDWKAGGNATTTGDGGSYLNFQSIVSSGLAKLQAENPGDTIVISGMIWMQGESDAVAAYSSLYQANLTNFLADVRATYGASLPIVIGQLSVNQTNLNATYLNTVRNAQSAVAAANPLNGLVVTDTFALDGDNLHFNRPGQVALGYAFATEMQKFVAVPEPSASSLALIGLALGSVLFAYRKRARAGS